MIYGTDDDGVPYSNPSRMKIKLDNLGVVNSFITFNGVGHIWVGDDLENATNITLSWFQSKL